MISTLDQHIVSTPDTRGGRPRIAGHRISVDDVVIMYNYLGQSVEEIASKYNLSPASVHAALAYYYDHKADIEKIIADDHAVTEAFEKNNPSLLKQKLKAINGA